MKGNEIRIGVDIELGVAPAVPGDGDPFFHRAFGITHSDVLCVADILHRVLFIDGKKKLFHILFVAIVLGKAQIGLSVALVGTVEYGDEIIGIEKFYRLVPVGFGKVGEMEQVTDAAKTGIDYLVLNGDGIGQIVFALI